MKTLELEVTETLQLPAPFVSMHSEHIDCRHNSLPHPSLHDLQAMQSHFCPTCGTRAAATIPRVGGKGVIVTDTLLSWSV